MRRPLTLWGWWAVGMVAGACDATIASQLQERQANEVVVALEDQGIGATKSRDTGSSDEGWRVDVDTSEASKALAVLRTANLPREPKAGVVEVFGTPSLVPTAREERARYTAALSGELARSIEVIDGVLEARVHVALPDPRTLRLDGAPPRPRASVLIKRTRDAAPLDDRAVQRLVAGAVHELKADQVAVVQVTGPRLAKPVGHRLVRLGPVEVSDRTAAAARVAVVVTLGLNALLAAALLAVGVRRRRPAAG